MRKNYILIIFTILSIWGMGGYFGEFDDDLTLWLTSGIIIIPMGLILLWWEKEQQKERNRENFRLKKRIEEEKELLKLNREREKERLEKEKKELELKKEEEKRLKKLKQQFIKEFDKDNNNKIDIIEEKDELNLLLTKHQKIIIERGKEYNENYIQQFIKVSNYLKNKRNNLQLIFETIKKEENLSDYSNYTNTLRDDIHSYYLILFNSLNLIVSLIENDQLTFYSIYEKFDKLNIYNSNWENEMLNKLSNIDIGIKSLINEIRTMSHNIINAIDDLSYATEQTNNQLDSRLKEINSSVETNNLLTLINTYQSYRVNVNTKSLRQ